MTTKNYPATAADVRDAHGVNTNEGPRDPRFVQNVARENAARWRTISNGIREAANLDSRDLTASEQRNVDKLDKHASELDALVDELTPQAEARARKDAQIDSERERLGLGGGRSAALDFRGEAPYMVRNATREMSDEETFWRDWLTGREPVNHIDVDLSAFDGVEARDRETGRLQIRNELTTSDTTVPTEFQSNLYRHIVEQNMVMSVASVDIFQHGRQVKYPKSTVRGTAAITGEGSAIAEGEGGFGTLTLDSWGYKHLVRITNELLEDVEFDLTSYIAFDAGRAIGKASGADFAVGTGTNEPRGVITATAFELGTAQQVASATVESDNLIDLYYSVSAPYRERAFWLMNDSTAKAIRKLKNADDEYVWTDGLNGAPAQILGRPVLIDPAVANIGSANLSVGFFNADAYKIRTQPLRFQRSDDRWFEEDEVGFRAVARMDADLLDSTSTTSAVLDTD